MATTTSFKRRRTQANKFAWVVVPPRVETTGLPDLPLFSGEFIESLKTLDLISIGIVADDGREYYAVSREFDPRKANEWVVENVLSCLPGKDLNLSDWSLSPNKKSLSLAWKYKRQIKNDILSFCSPDLYGTPEFWADWAAYDWLCLCQIFGTMADLPKGYPMYCNDTVQFCEQQLGLSTLEWPASLETEGNHRALLGAQTVKLRHAWCTSKLAEVKELALHG